MALAPDTDKRSSDTERHVLDIVDKWGQEVAEGGFAQIPAYLIYINQFADTEDRLSPVELVTLIQLVSAWWKKDEAPFPSIKTLAARSGVSERQMQRAINNLEAKNLIKRVKKKARGVISSNAYDLSPLVEELKVAAKYYETPYKRNLKTAAEGEKRLPIKPKPLKRLKQSSPAGTGS
jgi:predicted transcriptional regulator